jgi:hypothetical protein
MGHEAGEGGLKGNPARSDGAREQVDGQRPQRVSAARLAPRPRVN